jgi:predicted PurR-regulated permease PerM
METIIIIFTVLVVVVFTALSFYTSINKGANKVVDWIKKYEDDRKSD